jgi:hypothetical protein
MMEEKLDADVQLIGLDLVKSVFQLHGVDVTGDYSAEATDASAFAAFLRDAANVPDRHRGLRPVALLGP